LVIFQENRCDRRLASSSYALDVLTVDLNLASTEIDTKAQDVTIGNRLEGTETAVRRRHACLEAQNNQGK
jgi:hypothetical protein